MERLSEEEARDIASDWVKNLRSRFRKMGLTSVTGSQFSIDSAACSDQKAVNDETTTRPNCPRIQANGVCEDRQFVSKNSVHSLEPIELSHSSVNCEIANDVESTLVHSRIADMPTIRTKHNDVLDLERLREKRLAYFQRVVRNVPGSANSSLSNEHLRENRSLQFNEASLINSMPSKTRNFGDISERQDDFYSRPRQASTSRNWEKKSWNCDRFDEVRSLESDDVPRFKSNDDDMEFMLGWWGLNDLSTEPELRRYFPKTGSKFDCSRKTIGDSGNRKPGRCLDQCGEAENRDLQLDLKASFHVFPVGFDKDDAELEESNSKSGMLDALHCSTDEDSDFTLDDPIPKLRTPRCSSDLLSGNSPRNLCSYSTTTLSQSLSPPVPQIKGSLYFEFSGEESMHEQVPEPQVPDACTAASNDESVNWSTHQRPRSLSQPSAAKGCYEKLESILRPMDYKEDDPEIIKLCSFLEKPRVTSEEAVNCKHGVNNFEDIDTEASPCEGRNEAKSKDENRWHTGNTLVSPRSSGELGTNKPEDTVRVCPECKEVNTSANWCIECGLALVNLKSSKPVHNMKQRSRTNSVSSDELPQSSEPKEYSSQEKSMADVILCEKNSRKNASKQFKQDGRRWEKSSLAWNTYKDSHLSKPPGFKNFKNKSKNNFVVSGRLGNIAGRPRSASCKNSGKIGGGNSQNHYAPCKVAGSWPKSHKVYDSSGKRRHAWNSTHTSEMRLEGSKANGEVKPTKKNNLSLDLSALDDHAEIIEMIRSSRGNPLPYLCLPDEIILRIFSLLSHPDLARCSQVCQQFGRISQDECLWKTIVLKKNHNICDEFLEKIGSRKPVSLSLIQCRGNLVTSSGLRELFRRCAENLEELNFSGCNGGQLIGESILLHVAIRCSRLRSVDASWSNVGDNGIQALVKNVDRLESLCLNGCQAITDNSLKAIADKHGESLKIFEIFGCFNVSAAGIKRLGQKCPHLQTLNLGQCYKITSAAIGQLVSHLESIVNLDLRGCKQARDACVKTIAKHCPLLVNLVLANCPLITDVAMAEIATNLPSVRCLDVCGCVKVTDHGVRALARSCNRLNYLDLSSTSITQKSVMLLANYCSQNLESLKLSFCVKVTDDSVSRLVKHCKRMTTLHLYGCKGLRNVQALQKLNHALKLEF